MKEKSTIALVDDERNILTSLRMALEAEGYKVRTYGDGVSALEALAEEPADLGIFDIKMPRMDGIAAARAIRSLEGPEAMTPIVALTANVDPEDARSYLAAGMCCVVEKPIKPDRLLQAINIALAEAQAGSAGDERIAAA